MEVFINGAKHTLLTQVFVDERHLIVERVRRWGGASCDALLDPACKIFSIPSIDGLIGYRDELDSYVAFGDPVCPLDDIPHLARAFQSFCKEQGKSTIYISASESFARWAIENICGALVEFGEQLFIDPYSDPKEREGVDASLVRRETRHALKE